MSGLEEALGYCLQRGLTFAAFRWQGGLHLWVQHEAALATVAADALDTLSDAFVLFPFHAADGRIHLLRPAHRLSLDTATVALGALEACSGQGAFGGSPAPAWSRQGHAAAVAKALRAFAQEGLRKVVLARSVQAPFPATSLPALFQKALQQHPHAFVCLLNCPEYGTWLGASPERLVQVQAGAVLVESIAGTLAAELAPDKAGLWGEKERIEQELVSEAILATFHELGLAGLDSSGPSVFTAGPVAHLKTCFRARLGDVGAAALVRALHPTPAVCGLPRDAARAFILEHEPHERRLYAGAWGPWHVDGASELFVNIRCLQAHHGSVDIHVGGGITPGSVAGDEWRETEQKARTWMLSMQALQGRVS